MGQASLECIEVKKYTRKIAIYVIMSIRNVFAIDESEDVADSRPMIWEETLLEILKINKAHGL